MEDAIAWQGAGAACRGYSTALAAYEEAQADRYQAGDGGQRQCRGTSVSPNMALVPMDFDELLPLGQVDIERLRSSPAPSPPTKPAARIVEQP
jgi:hypothetical protein